MNGWRHLERIGVDLTQLNGIGPYSAPRIVAECTPT
jgi:hypothetical protein